MILKAVQRAARKLHGAPSGLSLVFVSPQRMRSINKKYLKHDYVTDVVSFDLGDGLGEVIVCPQIAKTNAVYYRASVTKEIVLYVVHGLLHVSGYDDRTESDRKLMRVMERLLINP